MNTSVNGDGFVFKVCLEFCLLNQIYALLIVIIFVCQYLILQSVAGLFFLNLYCAVLLLSYFMQFELLAVRISLDLCTFQNK